MTRVTPSQYELYYSWIMTGASILLLFATLTFITCIETSKAGWHWYQNVHTLFNRAILIGICATVALNTCNGILLTINDPENSSSTWLLYALRVTFLSIGEMSYFIYTTKRGIPIVEQLNLKSYRFMKWLMAMAPYSFILQTVPNILTYTLLQAGNANETITSRLSLCSFLFSGLSGLILLLSESYLIYTFIQFVYRTRQDVGQELDARFLIISKYGITAACCALFSFSVYIVGCFVSNSDDYVAATHGVFVPIFFILFSMKIALYRNGLKKLEDTKNRLEVAIGRDELDKIKDRKNPALKSGTAATVEED